MIIDITTPPLERSLERLTMKAGYNEMMSVAATYLSSMTEAYIEIDAFAVYAWVTQPPVPSPSRNPKSKPSPNPLKCNARQVSNPASIDHSHLEQRHDRK